VNVAASALRSLGFLEFEDIDKAPGVFTADANKNIHFSRIAGKAMDPDGVASDYHILNVGLFE
jgi:hypothetical protein